MAARRLPDIPVMVAGSRGAATIGPSGRLGQLSLAEAAAALRSGPPPLVCHAAQLARRVGIERFPALDVLELFVFIHPTQFCLPTVRGLAQALGLEMPSGLETEAKSLARAAEFLLAELAGPSATPPPGNGTGAIVDALGRGGWLWADAVAAALAERGSDEEDDRAGLAFWLRLPEWSESASEPPPGNVPVEAFEARTRLAELLGADAEPRPEQGDYASAVSTAFAPREVQGEPNVLLAEAGTGVGKTLGYLASASVWAEKNRGAVWISTFTRNLQRQIDSELDRLSPDPVVKARRVVVRKGRENYLCLLNIEEAIQRLAARPEEAVALGLIVRWALETRDGDMTGGDFPAWLPDLVGYRAADLTDHRGECIYSACAHYHKCFIERAVRRARRADIVIANHALVMTQAALGGLDDINVPIRLVFDEGHHVFNAADNAFSAHISGQEGADLRRWILGAEDRRSSRVRGLERRIGDVAEGDDVAARALAAAVRAARALPAPGWHQRIGAGSTGNPAKGPAEAFLALARQQVYARAANADNPYSLETETNPLVEGLADEAARFERALGNIARPLTALSERLGQLLDERAADLDQATRQRIEAVSRGLKRRGEMQLGGWRAMLKSLGAPTSEAFVDWFSVERIDGRDFDVGMHRHWVDPTEPFAEAVLAPAHGVVLTSATLRDVTGEVEADWQAAEARTGARHLTRPAVRASVPSPFDYPATTRVMVVSDVRKDDSDQVAAAYRELFIAAGGGALGLFTAISRLRAVHARIAPAIEEAGLPLLAQHVDRLNTTTLVDIFRAEENSCLLCTDAVRDGVDVPGRSLRLLVFDRVPWARRDILHRVRKDRFGGSGYDDMIARLRLKQAYGRLVRQEGDHGVFIMLDRMMPSRLSGAFPDGVLVHRLGLAEAIAETRAFLDGTAVAPELREADAPAIKTRRGRRPRA